MVATPLPNSLFHGFSKLRLLMLATFLLRAALSWAAPEPTTQASITTYVHVASGSSTLSSVTFTLSGGNGTNRILVIRAGGIPSAPADGTAYTANTAFGTIGPGSTTAAGSYVVLAAPNATTTVTVTGLAVGTAYQARVYSYNTGGGGPTPNYLATGASSVSFTPRAVYTWNVTGTGNISGTPGNWMPSRTSPTTTDIFIFNGSTTPSPTVTVNADMTTSQLWFINNVNAKLFSAADRNIVINGDGDEDLLVEAGSTLRCSASANNDDVDLFLGNAATGDIAGTVVFENTASGLNADHTLDAAADALVFRSGSVFRSAAGQSGGPFAGTITGSVIFESGATFIQEDGDDPFAIDNLATFEAGSTYVYKGGNFASTGHQYGNLEFQAGTTVAGTNRLTVLNKLTVTTGTVNLNVTGTGSGGIAIGGDVDVASGSALNFNPTADSRLLMNGSAAQSIGGAGSISTTAGMFRLTVDNGAGVTLLKPLSVEALTLTDGLLNTSTGNELTVALATAPNTATAITGASATRFVNGPMNITTTSSGGKSLIFPIGALRNASPVYRPLTLALTQSSTGGTYSARQVEGGNAGATPATGLQRVSGVRIFTLAAPGTTFTNGDITLSYGADDEANNAAALRVAHNAGGNWVSLGGTGSAMPAGTINSSVAFTTLGSFALGTSSTTLNPLPVELSSFTAERRGADALLKWTTALEKNSAYFDVQRSRDGYEFQAVDRVQAQGNSTRATDYSFLDKIVAGTVYYRLRQVDLDGTATLSEVRALSGSAGFTATAFPNPATDRLRVSTSGAVREWQVLSPVGQPLLRGTGQPDAVGVSSLKPGVYLLELTTPGTGRHTLRFVRQ